MVAGLALILTVAWPTAYNYHAGRWAGTIWSLVRVAPTIAGRSILFPPLAVSGAILLLLLWRGAAKAGNGHPASILFLGMLSWIIVGLANTMAFQAYFEPVLLIFIPWLASLCASSPEIPTFNRWWLGPSLLGMTQLILDILRLYLPVIQGG